MGRWDLHRFLVLVKSGLFVVLGRESEGGFVPF